MRQTKHWIGAAPMGASIKMVQKTLASGCVAFLHALQMMIGFMGPLYEYNGYLGSGIGGITADIFEARLSKRPSLFRERLRCLMQSVRLARKGYVRSQADVLSNHHLPF